MSTNTGRDKNRYPGLRPFVRDESAVFFGRNVEIGQLIDSINVNKSFILFGKSGLGKSSLISAGVLPKLVNQNIFPIVIRFYNANDTGGSNNTKNDDPLLNITKEIKTHLDESSLALLPEDARSIDLSLLLSLWTKPETPLLIFDQFEEFFYFDQNKREIALQQLAAIANHDVFSHPGLRDKTARESTGSFYEKKINLKLLFLIRSDRLNLMDEVFEKIPGIFNNRFNLKPLLKEKAEQSIVLPAQIKDQQNTEGYKTSPYLYDRNAVTVILEALSNKNGEIESSQLQIVCQELEQIAELKSKSNPAEVVITEEDFNGPTGIKEILNRFYWKQLDKLRNDPELKFSEREIKGIRYLIENELVSDKKRIIQSDNRVKEIIKAINPDRTLIGNRDSTSVIIDKLLDLRLIREEDSHLGKVYEISHDTLLESIIKSRDERMKSEREDRIKEQEELLAQEKQKSEQERKLKEKAREEREKAKEAERIALEAKKEAEDAWDLALDEEKSANRARRRLRWALAGLVIIGGIFTWILICIAKNSNEQRAKYQYLSGKIFLFNALTAYDNENHALAFNLASQADLLFDRNGVLLDSLVDEVWWLQKYSGEMLWSDNKAIVAYFYGNKTLQLFIPKDSVRKNNPNVVIHNVGDFKLSRDGTKLVTTDGTNTWCKFYHVYNSGKQESLEMKELLKTRIDTATSIFMSNDWVALFRKDTLTVYFAATNDSLVIKDPKLKGMRYGTLMSDNNMIYIERTDDAYNYTTNTLVSHSKFVKIDLKSLVVEEEKDVCFLSNSMNQIYIFDQSKKSIERIRNGSRIKIIDTRHTKFEPVQITESKDWYILSGYSEDGYPRFVIYKPDLKGEVAEISKLRPDNFGVFVQYSEDRPMFIQEGDLTVLETGTQFKKYRILFPDSNSRKDRRERYGFTLSADKSRIYFQATGSSQQGCITLSDASAQLKVSYFSGSNDAYANIKDRNFLFPIDNDIRKDSIKPKASYWKNFYEPLSDQDKRNYGIEAIK